jgi:Uma2 family endonuclease
MTAAALVKALPQEDFQTYLDLEAHSGHRNEFYHGLIYAMAGGSADHSRIVVACLSIFLQKLRNKPCMVCQSDLKVVTPKEKAAFYPDASVFCNQTLSGKSIIGHSPTLILEVLSPSTRHYDLIAKRKEYFRIPSLRHYLLVDSEAVEAILYTREENQTWPKDPQHFTDPKALIPLSFLNISLKLRDLYQQTDLL